jgi:hypothetical protein
MDTDMARIDQFIVDWPVKEDAPRPVVAVAVRNRSRQIGLYRVKQIAGRRMTLCHGGISFPVGTLLEVEDYLGLLPQGGRTLAANVVANDQRGIHLAW